MKEILFKGKRKDNGEWVEGYYFMLNENDHNIKTRTKISMGYSFDNYQVDPQTVSRYTGVEINDNIKIFQNDILQCQKTGEIFVVEWCNHQWQLCKNEYEYIGFCEIFRFVDFEIIGNIFDNFDLLESEVEK